MKKKKPSLAMRFKKAMSDIFSLNSALSYERKMRQDAERQLAELKKDIQRREGERDMVYSEMSGTRAWLMEMHELLIRGGKDPAKPKDRVWHP